MERTLAAVALVTSKHTSCVKTLSAVPRCNAICRRFPITVLVSATRHRSNSGEAVWLRCACASCTFDAFARCCACARRVLCAFAIEQRCRMLKQVCAFVVCVWTAHCSGAHSVAAETTSAVTRVRSLPAASYHKRHTDALTVLLRCSCVEEWRIVVRVNVRALHACHSSCIVAFGLLTHRHRAVYAHQCTQTSVTYSFRWVD